MRKIIAGFAALLATLIVSAHAVSTNSNGQIIVVYTNGLGQVIETVVGQVGTTEVPVEAPVAQVLQINVGTTIDTTDFTPSGIGQLLIWTTSNKVYTATGVTTNDWTLLN